MLPGASRRGMIGAMRLGFLLGGFLIMASGAGACGGKVVLDMPGGTGGAGGQGGSSSSTSSSGIFTSGQVTGQATAVTVGQSVGVGPACGCSQFCSIAVACGQPGDACFEICPELPPDIVQCVCSAGSNCDAAEACFGGGPGSGAGGGPSEDCATCVNDAAMTVCGSEAMTCFGHPGCIEILECHEQCGWGFDCMQQCENQIMNGAEEFFVLMNCVVCQDCLGSCQNTPLVNYCFDGG
jgi:hypothetical protein